jgi:hypothetical protein
MKFCQLAFSTAIVILLAWLPVAAANAKATMLFLRGAPDSAVVSLNGRGIQLKPEKPIVCEPGPAKVQVMLGAKMLYSHTIVLGPGERKLINLNANDTTAMIDIMSEPEGAGVSLNQLLRGQTPFQDSLISPGYYTIEIVRSGYDSITKKLIIAPREQLEMTITLRHSQAWLDSMATMKTLHRHQRQFIQKIAFGALATTLGGTALYFNSRARQNLQKADAADLAYESATSDFNAHKDAYNKNRDAAGQDMAIRNALWVAAGGALICVGISFVF